MLGERSGGSVWRLIWREEHCGGSEGGEWRKESSGGDVEWRRERRVEAPRGGKWLAERRELWS